VAMNDPACWLAAAAVCCSSPWAAARQVYNRNATAASSVAVADRLPNSSAAKEFWSAGYGRPCCAMWPHAH